MKLSELASKLNTEYVKVLRDCNIDSIELCSKIRGKNALTYLEKEKFIPMLSQEGIAGVICTPDLMKKVPPSVQGILLCDAPKYAFYCLHNALCAKNKPADFPTRIDPTAQISPAAYIAPTNVIIGAGSVIDPAAVILEHTVIGKNSHIYANAVIGAKSFNPAHYRDLTVTMMDAGTVRIGNHVEVMSNSVVVRGVLFGEETFLDDYVKIDTLVHIAHGSRIGRGSTVVSGCVIAGNCTIGDDVWIGPNSTVSNRITIGDGARVSLGSVVTKDVPPGQTVSGNFAIEHQRFLQNLKESISENTDSCKMPPPAWTFVSGRAHSRLLAQAEGGVAA